ncbi:MAG: hypothetical protein LIO57_02600 [Oscillospiraceae bacterium]|nr:hypothetical protein [Oscillospiraceae bacterium]
MAAGELCGRAAAGHALNRRSFSLLGAQYGKEKPGRSENFKATREYIQGKAW